MRKSGLAFHYHHDILVEFCYDYNVRVESIKQDKPADEQEIRLRLLLVIPEDKVPKTGWASFHEAVADYDKAWATYQNAGDNYEKAWTGIHTWADYQKAQADYNQAEATYNKARADCDKAWADYQQVNKQALIELHNELCPDCPFSGSTIFTRKNEKGEWY